MGSNWGEVIDEIKINHESQEVLGHDWLDVEMKSGSQVPWVPENAGQKSLDVKKIKSEKKENDEWSDLEMKPGAQVLWASENTGQESVNVKEIKSEKKEINDWPDLETKPGSLVSCASENTGLETVHWKDIKTEQKDVIPITEMKPGVTLSLVPFVKLERKYEIENVLTNKTISKMLIKQELKDFKLCDIESNLLCEESKENKYEPTDKVCFPTFYICENCDKYFDERDSLEKHACSRPRNDNRKADRIVQQKNVKTTSKKSHKHKVGKKSVNKQRQDLKTLFCHHCKDTFILKEDLVIHLRQHIDKKKKYTCNDCGKRFWHKRDMVKHPCMVLGVKNTKRKCFECDICDQAFRTANGLQTHMRRHYLADPWSCKICGKSFKRLGNLNDHENVHIGGKPYKCKYCDKHFRQPVHRNVHERIHKNSKPYSCRHCKKNYSDKSNLLVHELTHSGERPFKCDECGKKFTQKSHLNTHRASHSSERKYSCEVCGLRFKQRGTLQSHVYTHMDEKPYNCLECGRGFSQPTAFRVHICQ